MASWDMLREFDSLRREIDEAFRGAGLARPFGSTFLAPITTQRFPLVNLSEDDGNLFVYALVPGVEPTNIDLAAIRNSITISGERKPFQEREGQTVHRSELGSGKFSRTVELPVEIDSDRVHAECRDGVLMITLGKAAHAIPKKIEIKPR